MSVLVSSWVWEYSEAAGSDRLVLLVLADEANDDGLSCHPGHRRIARKARIGLGTVREALARLEAAGEILAWRPKTQGRGHYSRYVVLMGSRPESWYFDGNDWRLTDGVRAVSATTVSDHKGVDHRPLSPVDDAVDDAGETRGKGSIDRSKRAETRGPGPRVPIPDDPDNPGPRDPSTWGKGLASARSAARLGRDVL